MVMTTATIKAILPWLRELRRPVQPRIKLPKIRANMMSIAYHSPNTSSQPSAS